MIKCLAQVHTKWQYYKKPGLPLTFFLPQVADSLSLKTDKVTLYSRIVNCKLHMAKAAQAKLWKSEVCLLNCATHISNPLLQRNFPVLCLPSLELNSQLLVLRKKKYILNKVFLTFTSSHPLSSDFCI